MNHHCVHTEQLFSQNQRIVSQPMETEGSAPKMMFLCATFVKSDTSVVFELSKYCFTILFMHVHVLSSTCFTQVIPLVVHHLQPSQSTVFEFLKKNLIFEVY